MGAHELAGLMSNDSRVGWVDGRVIAHEWAGLMARGLWVERVDKARS